MNRTSRDLSPWSTVTEVDWNSWTWQLRNALHSVDDLNAALQWTGAPVVPESDALRELTVHGFEFKVTPHMILALQDALNRDVRGAWMAFSSCFVPTEGEHLRSGIESGDDRIGEEEPQANPVHAITSFYENRALFRVTHMCAAYCRYCFRRRMVGDGEGAWNRREIEEGIAFVARTPAVREVILSGGDPFILSDDRLRYVIDSLRAIPHVRRLRIDTKVLTMMPQRITPQLVDVLASAKPFYVISHFTHPYELTEEVLQACARLVDRGIIVGSHTPMLRGVTDSADVLCELFETLVDHRVLPYYLIHFIPTAWTEHFRVPLEEALDIVRGVQAKCGGLSVPAFIVYLPDAGGKVVLSPNYLVRRVPAGYIFKAHDGREILYEESDVPAATSTIGGNPAERTP